ncbi:MAG: CopG family transcriptional regulator [Acidobacteriota bacterium]
MKDRYDFSRGKRGAIDPVPKGRTRITIPIDDEILNWFREKVNAAGGGDYCALINNALKDYVRTRKDPLEEVVRRVVREELSSSRRGKKSKTTPSAKGELAKR